MSRRRQIVLLLTVLAVMSFILLTTIALTGRVDVLTLSDLGNVSALRLLRDSSNGTMPSSALLFYVHVPKTAGQSFSLLVRTCVTPKANLTQQQQAQKFKRFHMRHWIDANSTNSRNSSIANVDDSPRESARRAVLGVAQRIDMNFAQVASFMEKFKEPDYLKHFFSDKRFGLGHCDTSIAAMLEPTRETVFITMLRQPVPRVKSLYYFLMTRLYIRSRSLQSFVEFVDALNGVFTPSSGVGARNASEIDDHIVPSLNATSVWWTTIARSTFNLTGPASLAQFATLVEENAQDNYQTRALSGNLAFSFGNTTVPRRVDSDMLLSAKAALRAMPFFGLTEFYNASVVLFEESIGTVFACQRPAMLKRNITPAFRSRTLRAPNEQIQRMERYDEQLYAFAKRLFLYRCEHSVNCKVTLQQQLDA
jgi:hypothetical protein